MSRTVRQCIVVALENLDKSQLRCFKEDLSEVDYRPGYTPIPRGKLEDADAQTLGRLLVSTYREDYAAELTVQVLEGMSQREVADSLLRSLPRTGTGTGTAGGPTVAAAVSGAAAAHPIDRYFTQIVQQFHSTELVMDSLMAMGVLTGEHYERLRSKSTNQEKNRELLVIIRGRGPQAKEHLWNAMREADPYFVGSLAGN